MRICTKCVLPEAYPGIEFDENGVCNFCRNDRPIGEAADRNDLKNEEELFSYLDKFRNKGRKYDVLVPLSGGVDSSNALITLAQKYHFRVLGFHNDQGYEDDVATRNVRALCQALSVDLVLMQQETIYMNKLYKYVAEASMPGINSCYVCGNILYINALETADRFQIPLVINGYSKGQAAQIGDTVKGAEVLSRLIKLIRQTGDREFFDWFTEKYNILEKRVAYTGKEDLVCDLEPGKILFIPFYIFNFYKMDKEVLRQKIRQVCDWQPMPTSYPGRTTNCKMIWLNTFCDLKKLGYSNYTLEYSELIRRGEISREQALKDLAFNPPEGILEELATRIGLKLKRFD